MRITVSKMKSIILLLIALSISKYQLSSQNIVRDTMVVNSYGTYCEEYVMKEYYLNDSLYKVYLKNKDNYDLRESLLSKTNSIFHRMSLNQNKSELYSFRDFKLCIGKKCFSYKNDFKLWTLGINYIKSNLDNIYLYLNKTNERIQIQKIQLTTNNIGGIQISDVKSITIKQQEEVTNFLKSNSFIEIQIPSLTYPIHTEEECVQTTFKFFKLKFRILNN